MLILNLVEKDNKVIPFMIVTNYLGINVTKEVNDFRKEIIKVIKHW